MSACFSASNRYGKWVLDEDRCFFSATQSSEENGKAARSLIERQDLDSSFFYVIAAYITYSTRKSRGQPDAETERSGTESVSIDNEYGGRGAAPI